MVMHRPGMAPVCASVAMYGRVYEDVYDRLEYDQLRFTMGQYDCV
jgi:hypothetical protein